MARSGEKLGQKPTAKAGGCSSGPGDGGSALPELRRLEKHLPTRFLLGKKTPKPTKKPNKQLNSLERLSAIVSELGGKAEQHGEWGDTSLSMMLESRPSPA